MMTYMYLGLFLILSISRVQVSIGGSLWSPQPDVCDTSVPKGRVPWIVHVRDSNYGWGEHTHRAMIALAVNDYKGKNDEMRKMALQLEVELTKALFFNKTSPMHDSDLALYIHALLANNKNPRNFHGIDLVADLLYRVESTTGQVNPFLILALCNAHVVEYEHLEKISGIADRAHSTFDPNGGYHPDVDSREAQLKALAYKAFACAAERGLPVNKFQVAIKRITECLHRKYNKTTGSFGNIYTTALAVQAFNAVPSTPNWWDESKSVSVLLEEAEIDVNLIKAYYIEMALNSKKHQFISDLYEGIFPLPVREDSKQDSYYVTYTIKESRSPDKYFTLTINVRNGSNFYDIMKMASIASDVFKFTSYTNNNGEPMVYSVSGIPNDVEENMFWRLCKKPRVNHNYQVQDLDESPVRLVPNADDHFMYLYSNAACPK